MERITTREAEKGDGGFGDIERGKEDEMGGRKGIKGGGEGDR